MTNNDLKILIVEDDRTVMNLLKTTLKLNGYSYITAVNGAEAISVCSSHNPGIILLDLGLPDIDGIEVIESVRAWSKAAIIIISAREEDDDKIAALDAGADDYITKPFSVNELLARIRSAQRRLEYASGSSMDDPVFRNGDLTLDYSSNTVLIGDEEIHLTPIEYKLLSLLSKNAGKVLTHSYIISHIWGNSVSTDIMSLRVYMTTLRKKLGASAYLESLIVTHVGIGYQMKRISGEKS
jgi:two-component system KDP operon response regulator KdpE